MILVEQQSQLQMTQEEENWGNKYSDLIFLPFPVFCQGFPLAQPNLSLDSKGSFCYNILETLLIFNVILLFLIFDL